MPTLSRPLRKALENAVAEARNVAEEAAEKALNALAVGEAKAHGTMTELQKALRNRLRAHGRQLGDVRSTSKDTQSLDRLVAECAYEHWHRLLFARFLADNQLLLEPESGVSIAIDEIKELARSRGTEWVTLAGEFAVRMLPQVFRQDDPVLQLQLAPEDRKRLEELLESLSTDVFTATDSLGWCYQFWQAERKDEINAAGNKIGAEELPAVTQLFTEDYMVDFLLDNTLGAWHAAKVLTENPRLAMTAQNESELRLAVAQPGCPWNYLRFTKGKDGTWTPAAGKFDGWPRTAKELKCLDPCMGSGHFVVAMFERLVALRLAEEELDEEAAVAAVIRGNLFGLEIDPRCTQIGAFNLALAAWRRVGHCQLPAMNLACSGLAPNTPEANWLVLAGKSEKLKNGMQRLYRLFKDAPVLGSLINPRAGESNLLDAGFYELQPLLEKALAQETKDDTALEMSVTARGLAKAAEILAGQFTLVATNVPYLKNGKQDAELQEYCDRHYANSKGNLACVFVERCLGFCATGSTFAGVVINELLFLVGYRKLREHLLAGYGWQFAAKLGAGAFETITGEVVNVSLIAATRLLPIADTKFLAIDAGNAPQPEMKAEVLRMADPTLLSQKSQLLNPDARISVSEGNNEKLLSAFSDFGKGSVTGDGNHYLRLFWELPAILPGYRGWLNSPNAEDSWSGREHVVMWELKGHDLRGEIGHMIRGDRMWGHKGVAVCKMSGMDACLYAGELFDDNIGVLLPNKQSELPAIFAFAESPDYRGAIRRIDQAIKVTAATLVKVPFDLARWQKVAAEKYPHGLPRPFSSDPTQWLFNGHPAGADQPLHVAVARLLGYQWPRQTGSSFPDCPALGPDGLEKLGDNDGIVPISPAKGEGPAAERLRELLAHAYGKDWNATRQEELLAQLDYAGASLEDWLRNGFFEQHCALFHNRPFIWHVWDGLDDGFHALVNYHKLAAPDGRGRKTLEKLAFSYLGDWIGRQKAEQKQGKEGADAKLAAALHLQEQLRKVLAGEPPCDLFVRWKPLHDQAIGWEPDLNDGVRMNIRPFMMAGTLKGKSILRKAPKIKWDKDRGKEPERSRRDFPWFWGWNEEEQDFGGSREFDGNRWNDPHYTTGPKKKARARLEEKVR